MKKLRFSLQKSVSGVIALLVMLALSGCGSGPASAPEAAEFAITEAGPPEILAPITPESGPPSAPAAVPAPEAETAVLPGLAAAADDPSATEAPKPPRRIFGFLRKPAPADPPNFELAAPDPEAGTEAGTDVQSPAETTGSSPETNIAIAATDLSATGASEPARRRLFGFLRKPVDKDLGLVDEPAMVLAAVAPEAAVPDAAQPVPEKPRRGGLFRRNKIAAPEQTGPVPFGEVVRVCGVKKAELGREVARTERSGFRLFDTNPASTEPRTQFLTGFKDGCARQFTASLALFGAPAVHEATRYDQRNTTAYSRTDTAYERVKNRICAVKRGQPCPDRRAANLERQAAFVTIYPQFGGPGEWLEVFLHKGQLVTYQLRRP